ncbi:MAG: M48 family peptidase, partial [Bacteroidetes bacterium]|nr:M48 family peptidase [Bacteroidota bacterium]
MTTAGIEFELTRKRVKNINLRIHPPDGRVTVSAPLRMS